MHPAHRAARFGLRDSMLKVFKDGELISDVYEVDAVREVALRYEQPLRTCECGGGAAAYRDHGKFTWQDTLG